MASLVSIFNRFATFEAFHSQSSFPEVGVAGVGDTFADGFAVRATILGIVVGTG